MKTARLVLGIAVCVAFVAWVSLPIVAEFVGAWR